MKQLCPIFLLFLVLLLPAKVFAQEVMKTSFDNYTIGSINSQNRWSVSKGEVYVVEDANYAHSPSMGVRMINTSIFQADHIAYTSTQTGIAEDVYIDFWIKINSITTGAFSIAGYDLTSNSRNFMIEFAADGKIKVYSGSSGSATIKPTYAINEWMRLSFKISNDGTIYKFALNGNVYADNLNFREIKGTDPLDYHSIRFIQSSGACDIALDDMYIGTDSITGISFGSTGAVDKQQFTLTTIQPANGTITLSPKPTDGKYAEGTKVTSSVDITDLCKYRFIKWTNDISGTTAPVTFTINKDMTIGAEIGENPATPTTITVKNYNELKTALEAMSPGDIVELEDGDYSGNAITVTKGGCLERPIIVRAKNQNKANIKGQLYFTLKNIGYVTFEGLNFDLEPVPVIFKLEGCNNIRITKNEFRMQKLSDTQTSKWILIGDVWNNIVCTSHHNRIDHNLFDGKYDGGSWVVLDGAHGTSPGDVSKYDRIDHNHFRNNTPRAANEKETIRLGVSDLTPSSAYCVVENNLFENCDGDPEIVSVKSCDNIIRGNTFRGCLGTVCLRQGFRNTVDGNYFFGDAKTVDGNGCGGVRVYGKDHKIINNYFYGLTGEKWDAACTITNGDVLNNSTSWSSHNIPENVVFAFNTYINNKSDIEIGFTNNDNYGKQPVNCLIANNIYTQNQNPIVKAHSSQSFAGVSFSDNIMYANGTGSIGETFTAAQVKQVDPMLIETNCRTFANDCANTLPYSIYKLKPESPAIDAATGTFDYVATDFEGQTRTGKKDIGADEYNNESITTGMLSAEYVGPNAIPFALNIGSGLSQQTQMDSDINISLANKSVQISFTNESGANTIINIYNLHGSLILSRVTEASEVSIPMQNIANGIYLIQIVTKEYTAKQKFILR